MNRTRLHSRILRRSVLASAIACCFAPGIAPANPVGPVVTHGQASFSSQGGLLTVTNTPGAIINWRAFSIGAGETTRFVQQSAASAVLNRVVGKEASSIFGALQSNGRVFLVNPNGILFGAGAQIDTAGLIASTLNIMDADFIKGRLRFGDTPGAGPLSNAGEIRTPVGGRVLLIAPEGVENSGVIHAPNGEIVLAAGKTVELADSINPQVRVEVSAPESKALNLGRIVAESGRVGIYGGIVSNRGIVSADTAVVGENGKIVFKATHAANLEAGSVTSASGKSGGRVEVSAGSGTTLVAGEVRATGSEGAGGEVRLLGERVGLADGARVDVSGERGGGAALVGGDLQGANPEVPNAQMTYVAAGARISADAGASGDGGKVIVWADDTTRTYGQISARGGRASGDGGFVETSGKRGLEVGRGPDLRAPAGKPGTWLLDPSDLDLVAGSGLDPETNTGTPFFAPLADTSTIGVDLINAQLDFGSDVVLTTTSRGSSAGTQPGNITVRAPIIKSAATTDDVFIGTTSLTLQAHNDIVITPGGFIMSTGDPLNVSLQANLGGLGGAITIGDAIVTRGGSLNVSGRGPISVTGSINTTSAVGNSRGSVFLTSSNGSVTLAAPMTVGFVSASAQGGALSMAGTIASNSSVSLVGRDGVSIAPGQTLSTSQFGNFSASASGAGAAITLGSGATVTANSASLSADNMDIQGTLTAPGAIAVSQSSFGRPINLGTEAGGALSLTQLELDKLVTTGTFSLGNSAGGAVTVSGPISTTVPAFFTVLSGTSYTQNAAMTLGSQLSINAPAMTIAAPLVGTHAGGISLSTDTLNVSNSVNASGGELAINTRSFGRQITLGVASPTGSALELTDAQQANLTSASAVRFGTGGPIVVAGPITRASGTLVLDSFSSSVSQAQNATISVPSLGASAATSIDLTQHNDVANFAADTCCSSGSIGFGAAAGKTVNITSVGGINGVVVNNFSGTGSITLRADELNIVQPVRVNSGSIAIMPESAGRTVTLGADVANTLGLTAAELNRVSATDLSIAGDRIDIAAPVTFLATNTTLGPVTPDAPVKIVSAKSGTALELVPAELGMVTAANLVLGGSNAGAVTVETATTVPATVSRLELHSGGASSSLTVDPTATLSAANSLALVADTVDLQATVQSTGGSIEIAPHSPRNVELGSEPVGALGLNQAELALLNAPAGTLKFGNAANAVNVNVTGAVAFVAGSAGSIALEGGTVTVNTSSSLTSPGALSLSGQSLSLSGPVAASGGNVDLVANAMAIGVGVNATGDINVRPRDPATIDLGGADGPGVLGLTNAELLNLSPSGVLRIGDLADITADIRFSAPITFAANRVLSLQTSAGGISQGANATLTMPGPGAMLAAEASDFIQLDEPNRGNQVATVALATWFGPISFVNMSGGGSLTVGSVDGVTGISAEGGFSPLSLQADQININQPIFASSVDLLPSSSVPIDIGTKSNFGFTAGELNQVFANTVTVGNAAAGNISVSAPVSIGSFSDLNLVTGAVRGATVATGADLSVPGKLSITAGTLSTAASLTSTGGGIMLVADALAVGGSVSAFDAIQARPLTGSFNIDLGGADVSGVLGITAAEVSNLSAPTLIFGSAPRIDVTAPITTGASVQRVELRTDDLVIPAGGGITTPSVFVSTITPGRNVDLGAAGVGSSLVLDAATLGRLTLTDALSIDSAGPSTLTVRAPFTVPAPDLSLGAGTINVNESLAVNGDLALQADTAIAVAAGKTASAGGDILVTKRSGSMTIGSGGLIDAANLGGLSSPGFLELGSSSVSALTVAEPLDARPFGGLTLTASGSITQTTGSTISADQLRVQSDFGFVSLTQDNTVDVLAASAPFQSFAFTNAGALRIGSVDGVDGVAAGTVTLRADSLDVATSVSGSSVTLAPRLAGAAIDLGSDTGFGLTDAEIDRVVANTLTIGAASGNASGPITVSAPVDYANNLSLVTAAGSSIAVNAALGSAASGSIAMNAGAGGTVTVAAPVGSAGNVNVTADTIVTTQPIKASGSVVLNNVGKTGSATIGGAIDARFGVTMTSRTIAVNAPLTSQFSSVLLTAPSGASGSSVTISQPITAGSSISVTTDSVAINAPLKANFVGLQPVSPGADISLGAETAGAFSVDVAELALIDAGQLSVGASNSGDLQVNAPIGPFSFSTLSLSSGRNVSQTPGSTITVRTVDPNDPSNVSGRLNVFAGGRISLPEANDIAVSVSGSASGSGNDFVFNNVTPLKLQNVSGVAPQGKVIVRTSVPPPRGEESGGESQVLQPDVVRELNRTQDAQKSFEKDAQDRKDEAEKRDREEQKKRGTQSCS